MSSSTDSENISEYLKKEYVENFLKSYFKDTTLKVKNMDIKPASAKGESFCSIMTRMKVDYEIPGESDLKNIVFIIKSTYDNNPYLAGILRQYDIYNTEMEMYEIVLPQLQKMLQEIGDKDQLCAKTIHVDYQREVIVLEDLAERKFVTADRLRGMDEENLRFCLRKLAKMHATASALNERNKGLLEKYNHGIFNRHVRKFDIFYENVLKVCAKFARSCPELGNYYADKIEKLVPYAMDYAIRCCDPNPKHFLTLNHGDMWTNNFMVRYNDDNGKDNLKVEDVLLIDFQYCNWSSPSVDLHYFFAISLQDDVFLYKRPKLIQYYHQVLSETLKKLNYKQHIPTLHELNVQLFEREFYAVLCFLVNFPLLINDKTEDADLESLLSSDEKAQRLHNVLYTNKRVQNMVKIMLPKFDEMGLLDVIE